MCAGRGTVDYLGGADDSVKRSCSGISLSSEASFAASRIRGVVLRKIKINSLYVIITINERVVLWTAQALNMRIYQMSY